jgi:hypothetical protein
LFRRKENRAFHFPAVAPDGKTVALSEQEGLVLRDAATGKEIQTLHLGIGMNPTGFSADGKLFVAHTHKVGREGNRSFPIDGSLWVYSVVDRKMIAHFSVGDWIRRLAISPDKKMVATAEAGKGILLWEVATGKQRGCLEGHAGPVSALAFSADGRFLVSGGDDTTGLVWELAAAEDRVSTGVEHPGDLWTQLGDSDGRKAYRAICRMLAAPERSVQLLREKLELVAARDAEVLRYVAQLDDNRFAIRSKATVELEKLGELAEPALREALSKNPSLEVQQRAKQLLKKLEGPVNNPDTLRALRAIEVLEHIGSQDAARVLKKLAGGAPDARVTQEAKASLERLAKRPFPSP